MRVALIVVLLAGTPAFCATPDECSNSSTASDTTLALRVPDGRLSFREGEIIPLSISFTSSAEKRYWVSTRNYDRSGRLGSESYCIEPDARDPLTGYFRGAFLGGGLGGELQLSREPYTITAELNEWKQPAPGHYRLHIISRRVSRSLDPGETSPYGRVPVMLRSNEIEFDVIPADAEWAAAQLQEATLSFQNAAGDEANAPARRLRFLNTKESAKTLAHLFWGLNEQPGGWDLMFGLYGSPYPADALAALKSEINNPDHPLTQNYLRTITKLEINAEPQWDPPPYDPAHPEASEEFWRKEQAHERDLMQNAIASAAAALPHKAARARALTLQTLTESSDLLDPATAAQMRKQLSANWGNLPERKRLELIQSRWALIASPDMLPILKEFVAGPPPPSRTQASMAREAALAHIFELNPGQGRILIQRELRNPDAQPSVSLAKLLSTDELKPIVQEAVTRVEKNSARNLDFHLIELYGDASALPVIQAELTRELGQYACEPLGAMLRYLLRTNLEAGTQAVQDALSARKSTGCYRMLLEDLGKLLPLAEPIAIHALDDPDLEVARNATLALGHWGSPKAEPALWARLTRFHEEWKDREVELRGADFRTPGARAAALESELFNSLATATGWFCDPERFDHLRTLSSTNQAAHIAEWLKQSQSSEAQIIPSWFAEDHVTFNVLQYSNLDEDQFRIKLSQLPHTLKLSFPIWKHAQVSVEKQESVFQSLRQSADQFGLTIEEQTTP